MKTVEQLAREAGLHIYPEYSAAFQRFHDAAIAQYRESLLAGVGEPVAMVALCVQPLRSSVQGSWQAPPRLEAMLITKWDNGDRLYTADQMAASVLRERERLAEYIDRNLMSAREYAAAIRGQR